MPPADRRPDGQGRGSAESRVQLQLEGCTPQPPGQPGPRCEGRGPLGLVFRLSIWSDLRPACRVPQESGQATPDQMTNPSKHPTSGRHREVTCTLCQHGSASTLFAKGGKDFLRCRACGLVWVDPLPTPEELSRYYEEAYGAGSYASFLDAVEIRRLIAEHRLGLIRPWTRSGPWLDVGCAAGDFIAAAERAGSPVEGIDASAEAVERARARGLNVRRAGVETFRPESRYQTVSAFDLIEHLLDPRAFISGLADWLAPGGILVMTLPDVRSIYPRLLMGRHWFYYVPEEHFFYFDRNTISRLLESFGFTILHLSRATKPLTPRYATATLELFNPVLGRLSRRLVSLLPDALAARPWKIPVGEMLVIARSGAKSADQERPGDLADAGDPLENLTE